VKKTFLMCVFLAIFFCSLLPKEEPTPVATVTEIEGKAEIKRDLVWEQLFPLQALYSGDTIRISKGGKAVLIYLGALTEIITELHSPYVIKDKQVGDTQTHKAKNKLNNIIRRLMHREEERSLSLSTRALSSQLKEIKIIRPNSTSILYSKDSIQFRWQGDRPPYHISIYKTNDRGERKIIFEKEVEENMASVPAKYFVENAIYHWVIFSDTHQGGGTFHLLNKLDTKSILKKLSEILKVIPEQNSVTRYLIRYEFLVEKGFLYDASRTLDEARQRHPDNETFKKLGNY
jgi:hypothetical protein